jgi:hypothetical protein
MEPLEPDELSDRELYGLLEQWRVPEAPDRLRAAVFPKSARSKWRSFWGASIRIPLPVACTIGVVLAFGAWRLPRAAPPRVVTRTVRVEVPAPRETVVTRTVYHCQPGRAAVLQRLQPVMELQPRIIRGAANEE